MTGPYVLVGNLIAGIVLVSVVAVLLLGHESCWLRRRWSVFRPVLAADLVMLREGLRLAAAHWRHARAVLDAASQADPGRPEA